MSYAITRLSDAPGRATTSGPAMIDVAGLRKAFGDTTVLNGIDFAVPGGTVLALLGPNGSGKTTTVRILATLLRPDAGRVTVAGHDVVRDPRAVRRSISLTGQYAAVDQQQTGRENLTMIGQLLHLGRRASRRRADELLARFDLADAGGRLVTTYSGGMRRRLDLAMGLVGDPTVIFLDEPTTGLDPTSRATAWEAVRGLAADGATVLLTTQYLEEADHLADRVVLIDGGCVAAEGTPAELKRQVGGERIELEFADRDGAATAARTLAAAGTLPTHDGLTISLPSDGTAADLLRVLHALAGAGPSPERVDQRRPTLDDVFVAVTGAGATKQAEHR